MLLFRRQTPVVTQAALLLISPILVGALYLFSLAGGMPLLVRHLFNLPATLTGQPWHPESLSDLENTC